MRDPALALAALCNDLASAAELVLGGANPDAKDGLGYTPLMLAAARGHLQMVELLLTAGADPHILDDRIGASALHRAAQSSVPGVARTLLRHGAHIDLQAPLNGHTPLIDAVWHKRAPVVAVLLDEGARTDIVARLGYTALAIAERDGLTDCRALLVSADDERSAAARGQSLIAAVIEGDLGRVARVLREGSQNVNALSRDGFTALVLASQHGRADIVELLLAAGADPRIVDPLMKATPGHKAGYRGHAEVARVLCACGLLELDAQGPYNGYTALHDAVWHGHREAAEWFIRAGARLDLCGLDGRTPRMMAIEYGYAELSERLAEAEGQRTSDV